MVEKLAGFLIKGEGVILDNFVLGLNRQLREDGLFLVYITTRHTPARLKIIDAENGGKEGEYE